MKNTTLLCLPALIFSSACAEEALRGRTEAFSTKFQVARAATLDECPNGGVIIEYGIDSDGNGLLDEREVLGTDVVCHGANGADGAAGTNGQDGAPGAEGAQGPAGADGAASLISLSDEPAGDNCPMGGTRIDQGADVNANGTLDGDEILETSYVCHGNNGSNGLDGADGQNGTDGLTSLIAMQDILGGADCPNGGIMVTAGIDTDSNGQLDADEVTQTEFVCHGVDGSNGVDALNPITEVEAFAESETCPAGGIEIFAGLDLNDDGSLTADEVTSNQVVCNGTNGIDGVDGQDGVNGQDGADGQDGTNGQDGLNGQDGADGQNGTNGQDALPNYITSSIACAGALEGSSLYFNYSVAQFSLGEVFVTGGVYGDYTSVNASAMYSPNQVGFATAPVIFVNDALGTANQGYWTLSLSRETLITSINYTDIDGNLAWQMMPENCVVNDFTD